MEQITNHIEQAKENLLLQYQFKPKINSLLEALLKEIQTTEDLFFALNAERTLNEAVGVQLDLIGTIVGLSRVLGQSDDTYRILLRGKVTQNISKGDFENLISYAQAVHGSTFVHVQQFDPASVYLSVGVEVSTLLEAQALSQSLKKVIAAGVSIDLLNSVNPDQPFSFDGSAFGSGFGDANDSTIGGKFGQLYINL